MDWERERREENGRRRGAKDGQRSQTPRDQHVRYRCRERRGSKDRVCRGKIVAAFALSPIRMGRNSWEKVVVGDLHRYHALIRTSCISFSIRCKVWFCFPCLQRETFFSGHLGCRCCIQRTGFMSDTSKLERAFIFLGCFLQCVFFSCEEEAFHPRHQRGRCCTQTDVLAMVMRVLRAAVTET